MNGSVELETGSSEVTAGSVEFLAEFVALADSAPPSLPTTEDGAGVAIVVFVLFEEVDEVADSVLEPGIELVEFVVTGTASVELEEVASTTGAPPDEEFDDADELEEEAPTSKEGSSFDSSCKKFMSLFLRISV